MGIDDLSFINDGSFDQTAGAVTFTGTAASTIAGTVTPAFYILNLNKPGTTLQLLTSIHINNNFQFVNGLLDLNTNNIFLLPTAAVAGETETSHAFGNTGGYIEIIQSLNAPSAANPGNLGAVITSSQDLGAVTIRRGHRSQVNGIGNGASILRYYDIMPANNTALNATLRINYLDAELNNLNENLLSLFSSNDNVNWNDLAFSAKSTAGNYVEQTGLNNFSRFTLSETGNALPLIWNAFNTQCFTSQVRISWKTFQEQHTVSFTIRRSTNGSTWTNIGSVPAAGNSQLTLSYSFTDPQPLANTSYYQILQTDASGQQTISPVLTNRCGLPESINVYPNPIQQDCIVSLQSTESHVVHMRLYNNLGALLQQQTVNIQPGSNQFILKMYNYIPGIYSLLIIRSDGQTKVIKLEKF
jgi:hypothetical protein